MRRAAVVAGLSIFGGYVVLHLLGRRAGATAPERSATRPGDELVDGPQLVTDHAVTIAAPLDPALVRARGRMSPWWFAACYLATIPPADLVMARGMLRGLRTRAEAGAAKGTRSHSPGSAVGGWPPPARRAW